MSPLTRSRARGNRWVFAAAVRRRGLWERLSAPQVFAGSFLLLIAAGTLGLATLPFLYAGGEPLKFTDAAFTATSAVCVTGLIVVDTATHFTRSGQAFLLLLIQLGGLGIITFTTLILVALGRRLSLRAEALAGGASEIAPHVRARRLTRDIVVFTFAIEALGAALLYALWVPRSGWGGAFWPAVFHSVNAFCNAGFSTYSDSLMGFDDAPATLIVVSILIILGGLGFLAMEEVALWVQSRRRGRRYRLSLHTRIVLAVTALLLLAGWGLAMLLEWDVTLAGMPTGHRLANAWFLGATPRTAGFNSIDYERATAGTNFLTVILMSIGGSPGSTAGGLKTTTLALPVLLVLARLRGYEITSLWGRTIPNETVQRAVGLAVGGFALVAASVLLIVSVELAGAAHGETGERTFLAYLFEAVSAFNTVGLSMLTVDETIALTGLSKWVLIVLMFLGRVGLPTAAAALTLPTKTPAEEFRYAHEDVMVG